MPTKEQAHTIYCLMQLAHLETEESFRQQLDDWFSLCRILMEPESYLVGEDMTDSHLYKKEEIATILANFSLKTDTPFQSLILKGPGGDLVLKVFHGSIHMMFTITYEIFTAYQLIIENFFDEKMCQKGVYAYIRDMQEFLSHNLLSLQDRQTLAINHPKYPPLMYNTLHEQVVDCSQLAGYDCQYHGLIFTSCWKMWFSPVYGQWIPKQAFLDVQQVNDLTELSNGVIRITLHENPLDWHLAANLDFQRMFRDQLGFDRLEWDNGVGVLREPYAEFFRSPDQIRMIQYQNNYLQPVGKNQATYFFTRISNMKTGAYSESGVFGKLNSKAYFPWQDDEQKRMYSYMIIDPSLMIDQGVEAFTFYIHQYFPFSFKDNKLEDYQPILRFYIPEESLNSFPFEMLIGELDADSVQFYRKKEDCSQLLIKKNQQKMWVQFVNVMNIDGIDGDFSDLSKQGQGLSDKLKHTWQTAKNKCRYLLGKQNKT